MSDSYVTKKDLDSALANERRLNEKDIKLLMQGQATAVNLLTDLKTKFDCFHDDFHGRGGDEGYKTKIIENENHRKDMQKLLNNLTAKIITLLISLIGVAATVGYAASQIPK